MPHRIEGLRWTRRIGLIAAVALAIVPSAARATPGGTLDCENMATQSGSYVVALTPGSSAQSVDVPADAGTTTVSYCTLTGTVPSNWTISLFDVNVFAADGAVNTGTINFGSEFTASGQVAYSGNLLGEGTFTNDGTIVAEQDPTDSQGGGPDVIVEAPDFVNAGTFQVDPGLDGKGGSAAIGYQASVSGTGGKAAPPAGPMTFHNTGTFIAQADTTLTFGTTAASGLPFTFDNAGVMSVAATATEVWGTSNGYYCGHQGNTIDLTQESGSTITDEGSITLYCNTLDLKGGRLTGSDQLLFNGGESATFEPNLPVNATAGDDTIQSASGAIAGTVPAGWTVDVISGANGVLGAAPGTVNDGTIDFVDEDGTLDDSAGSFTNSGMIQTGDGHGTSTTFKATDLVNSGTIALTVGNPIVDQGNFTQTADGTLTTPVGATYNGILQVNGTASLAGATQAITGSGYTPAVGDTWQILRASPVSGTFGTVTGTALPAALGYSASYTSNSASIGVVSAPASGGSTPPLGHGSARLITATRVTADPAVSRIGQDVTFVASVSPPPDGGTVKFTVAAAAVPGCGAVKLSILTGTARCATALLQAKTDDVTAQYSGDAVYGSSVSPTIRERVRERVSLLRVAASAGRSQHGSEVRLRLGCAAGTAGCTIVVTLSLNRHDVVTTVAAKTISIKPGRDKSLTLALNATGRSLLAALGHLPARLTIVQRVGTHRASVTSRRLTIRS